MNRLGKALHLSKDGNLVLKAQRIPAIGAMTYDAKLRPVGVVSDIVGPKNAPYILVKTKLEDASKLQGQALYGEL